MTFIEGRIGEESEFVAPVKTESEVVRFAQSEGYMQVSSGRALLLVEEAHEPDELDSGQLRDRIEQAEREIEQAGEDSERRRVAERDKRRWEAFSEISGN